MKQKNKGNQLDLFSPETLKTIKIHAAIEQLKKEFGEKAVVSGSQFARDSQGKPRPEKRRPGKRSPQK